MDSLKTQTQGDLPVIDLELGAKILGGSQETAQEMLAQLASMLPDDLKKIQAAYESHQIETLQNLVHYVKGGASFCGVPRLNFAAVEFDKVLNNQPLNSIEFEKAYDKFCTEIVSIITEHQKQTCRPTA